MTLDRLLFHLPSFLLPAPTSKAQLCFPSPSSSFSLSAFSLLLPTVTRPKTCFFALFLPLIFAPFLRFAGVGQQVQHAVRLGFGGEGGRKMRLGENRVGKSAISDFLPPFRPKLPCRLISLESLASVSVRMSVCVSMSISS